MPKTQELTCFVFSDHFKSNLLATCKVEVHALEAVKVKIQAGTETYATLTLDSRSRRTVELFTSHPKVVYNPRRKERSVY